MPDQRGTIREAKNLVIACAAAGLSFETAAWIVAGFLKSRGLQVTHARLKMAFSE